ncbi:hypothetical protein NDU88_009321 [Pleurodeles waltl]|uniref:Uncharacterized protein n=1 Tax=Pleurodeles waltl TaxID=8319 RepID=A0AAV7P0C6_PLEWA|nr:hypothetical protein NDU88_009321 [Pleurodeles waltl]
MEVGACNFDTFSRAELLNLCKQKGLNEGEGATKLDLQVALGALEEEQRRWATSEENEMDDREEEGEDPAQNFELHHSTPVDNQEEPDDLDEAGSSVSSRGLSQADLGDRREERKLKVELDKLKLEKEKAEAKTALA